jgi:hypothetical protein
LSILSASFPVVALTNRALEGGFGAFVPAIRNALYGRRREQATTT